MPVIERSAREWCKSRSKDHSCIGKVGISDDARRHQMLDPVDQRLGEDLVAGIGHCRGKDQGGANAWGQVFSATQAMAIIVGGMGSILGGILGAVFMTMVPELLKLVFDLLPNSTQYTVFLSPVRTIIFGLLIIGFLVFEPHGLAEVWRRIRRFFHLWPFRN